MGNRVHVCLFVCLFVYLFVYLRTSAIGIVFYEYIAYNNMSDMVINETGTESTTYNLPVT